VFVDGCFWHACPIHGNQPRANTEYWRPKLARNVARDQAVDSALQAAGWRVLRAWEHEAPASIADRVSSMLGAPTERVTPRAGGVT
jgi:DNA mismatch endonuclease (patch repair protein)